jgi:hypothetical protein
MIIIPFDKLSEDEVRFFLDMNVNDEYRWLIYNKLVSLNTYQFDELMNNKKRKIYRSFADVVKKGKK